MTRPAIRLSFPVVLILLTSPWTSPDVSAQAAARKGVLVVHWGPEDHPSNLVMDRAVREVMAAQHGEQIDYFAEYLESDRFGPEESEAAFLEYLRQKYRGRRIDVLIATTEPSLRFVLEHQDDPPFVGVPIVFTSRAVPEEVTRLGRDRFTAVLRGTNYAATLRLALELHPQTERVFVVAVSRSNLNLETVQGQLRELSQRVPLTYISEGTVPRLLEAIRAVPPRSLILYVWFTQEGAGTLVHPDQGARLVAQASAVPVYGTSDLYAGTGVVGGLVRATRPMAVRLAEIALQIIDGTPPENIPVETIPLAPIFDWRELQRWGINPSRLPEGSDIQFRTATLWESHRSYIIAAVSVLAGQLVLIAALLAQRARRRRAEQIIGAKEVTLRTSYERIRQLNGRLINAQEEVRSEIARDLHDGVCQELVGISMIVSTLRRVSGRERDEPVLRVLSELERATLNTIEGVRRLSHDLHPGVLRLVGLEAALKAHCREVEQRCAVQVSFRADGDLHSIGADAALGLFRIVQETLRNGTVHGRARRLMVSVVRSGTEIALTVADDGRGFDLDAVRRDGHGLGLVSLEERAHLLGGTVDITTGVGHGTTIRVRVQAGVRPDAEPDEERLDVELSHVNALRAGPQYS